MQIGVLDAQSLGPGSLHEVVIGGHEDEGWQVIGQKDLVDPQRTSQVHGIVPAQFMTSGKIDSVINALRSYREHLITVSRVSLQLSAGLRVAGLSNRPAAQLAGKGGGNLHSTDVCSNDRACRVFASGLYPARPDLDPISARYRLTSALLSK